MVELIIRMKIHAKQFELNSQYLCVGVLIVQSQNYYLIFSLYKYCYIIVLNESREK